MINMQAIVETAASLDNDLEKVNRELKRIASVKCRLKKMPGRSDFQENMTAVLQEEELLKNVKSYISGPRKTVSTLTQDEVDHMTLDETMKALKAIQSKKTHTKWLTTIPGDNDEYREACRIEQMLKSHRDCMSPGQLGMLSKVDMLKMIDTLRLCDDLSIEDCLDRIVEYVKEV